MKEREGVVRWLRYCTFLFLFSLQSLLLQAQDGLRSIKDSSRPFGEIVREIERHYEHRDKGKGTGYKQFKRWEYFYKQRVRPDQTLAEYARIQAEIIERVKSVRKPMTGARISGSSAAGNWQSVGPSSQVNLTNYNGRVDLVVVDPSNPNIIYAGSPAGGLWRSFDGGKTWNCITDNILGIVGITSLAIDPTSPPNNRTLYIVTGSKDWNDSNYMGIFRSTDNGTNWSKIYFQWPDIGEFHKIVVHPANNKLLLMLNDQGFFHYYVDQSRWERKIAGNFLDFELKPSSPATIYLSGVPGTFRSTDSGATWNKVSGVPGSDSILRYKFAVSSSAPSLVYLFIRGYNSLAELYKSVDSGLTFTKVQTTADLPTMTGLFIYGLGFAVSPVNPNELLLGGVFLFRSRDGGKTWQNEYINHVDVHDLAFFHGYIYCGNDGGIIRKPIDASIHTSWEDLSKNLSLAQVYRVGPDPFDADHVLVGLQDNGSQSVRLTEGSLVVNGDGMESFVDHQNRFIWYTSIQRGRIFRSGPSLDFVELPQPPVTNAPWLSPFKMDPANHEILYLGYLDLWKNATSGNGEWVNVTRGFTGLDEYVKNFEVAPSNTSIIYVLKENSILYRTTNGGNTWVKCNPPPNPRYPDQPNFISSFAVHPENPDVLWCSTYNGPVFKSTDGGITWTNISGSLDYGLVPTALAPQKGTANGLYIGSDAGVFYRDDTMTDWVAFDNGIAYAPITDLKINYGTGKIYAATYGRGVFASNLYGSTPSACAGTGKIRRELWTNVTGNTVASIPLNSSPSSAGYLNSFEEPVNAGDQYGSRIRGYVCPPISGGYTFWIASDDHSELWLSTDENPANKIKIASVTGYTGFRQWGKYTSQKSNVIQLAAGKRYYIESLHKEASGGDNLSVGWQLPNGNLERPIPGWRIMPLPSANTAPQVQITSPANGQEFTAVANITINATASDSDGTVTNVEFFNGVTKLGEDNIAPYSFEWQDVGVGTYTIHAKATDDFQATATSTITISVRLAACDNSGTITREFWTGIPGTAISSIPLSSAPDKITTHTSFETPTYVGNDYGSRMRGYICAPITGNYTFWIASDDNSQLWLSTDDTEQNKRLIASVTGATALKAWEKYPSQRSALVSLEGGKMYYVEALHKEGTGNDHIAVGWLMPDGLLERPIAGERLVPFNKNEQPTIMITNPVDGGIYTEPASVSLHAWAEDSDGSISKVVFYNGASKLVEDTTDPFHYMWNNVQAGTYTIHAVAYDNQSLSDTASVTITVVAENSCVASGSIQREIWTGITGTSVAAIPVNTSPAWITTHQSFETPTYVGNDYGSRMRAFLCVPETGAYTFWIASDDNSELWLSTDQTAGNKRLIAFVNGATGLKAWDKYPSQKSGQINLTAGSQYYIEALHKEGSGNDHLAVGWQLPNGTFERPIAGNRLSTFNAMTNEPPPYESMEKIQEDRTTVGALYPNPYRGGPLTFILPEAEPIGAKKVMIEIHDMRGDVVFKAISSLEENSNVIVVDIDKPLTRGLYIFNAVIDRRRYLKKFIIETD